MDRYFFRNFLFETNFNICLLILILDVIIFPFSKISDLGHLFDCDSSSNVVNKNLETVSTQAFERRIHKLERENRELQKKIQGTDYNNVVCARGQGRWLSCCVMRLLI